MCDGCHDILSESAAPTNALSTTTENMEQTSAGSNLLPSTKEPSRSTVLQATPCYTTYKPPDPPTNPEESVLAEVAKEIKEIEQKEFVDFNNKHLSVIREESVEGSTPSTPPSTPVSATYPQPLPLLPPPPPTPTADVEKHPPMKKLFSKDVLDDKQLKETLDKMPQAPSEVPKVHIKPRNPHLYQLCQMNSTSSFWWDSSTDSNDEFGLNFRSDGVPSPFVPPVPSSPIHPQLKAAESVVSYYFDDNGRRCCSHLSKGQFSDANLCLNFMRWCNHFVHASLIYTELGCFSYIGV